MAYDLAGHARHCTAFEAIRVFSIACFYDGAGSIINFGSDNKRFNAPEEIHFIACAFLDHLKVVRFDHTACFVTVSSNGVRQKEAGGVKSVRIVVNLLSAADKILCNLNAIRPI